MAQSSSNWNRDHPLTRTLLTSQSWVLTPGRPASEGWGKAVTVATNRKTLRRWSRSGWVPPLLLRNEEFYFTAMKSISTAAPIGSAATPTVERLGFTSTSSKNSP